MDRSPSPATAGGSAPLEVEELEPRDGLILTGGAIALIAPWVAAGFALTGLVDGSVAGRADADAVRWFEDARTETGVAIADLASVPADTFVVIGLMAVLGPVLRWLTGRWHDWLFLVSALLLEVTVAATASFVVARPRPPVEQLATPPTESWPSGHTAAATTLYAGLVIIAHRHLAARWVRLGLAALAAVIVVGVALSRLYLGAHYVSDVVGGALLGAAVLAVTAPRFFRQRHRAGY